MPATQAGQPERRVHHRIRAVFSEACDLIAPLLEKGNSAEKPGSSAPAAVLRERYPELSALEVHVLITAATRMRQQHPKQS